MTLTGAHTVNAPAKKIWDMLMDTEILARITPAITRLEKLDVENYKAIAEVKIGPVCGEFSGNLKLTDIQEPDTFTLNIQQNSKIGNANAVVKMSLKALSDMQTELSFIGDVKLSGTLNMMGQRVLTPVANMLSKQFFEALDKEVVA
jgi:hypothetical protein